MKKNHGCGGHDKKHCPPAPACDKAKTRDSFATVGPLANIQDFERTVILADVPLTINAEADIHLPSRAADIKNIRKNVYLTQCKAVPVFDGTATTATALNLYIEGYVHKNIQYSEGCEGYIKDYSVNVPFRAYRPIVGLDAFPVFTSQKSNIREIRDMDKHGMGGDRCSFGSTTFENFNEPIDCKLLRARVTQMDMPEGFDKWGEFDKLTEKMTIDLVVRLTQQQRRDGAGAAIVDPFFG